MSWSDLYHVDLVTVLAATVIYIVRAVQARGAA